LEEGAKRSCTKKSKREGKAGKFELQTTNARRDLDGRKRGTIGKRGEKQKNRVP